MSRSFRQPVAVISPKIDKTVDNKRLRRKIKMELNKPEPDPLLIEEDTTMFEEWGTKLDYIYIDPDDTRMIETQNKLKRK